MTAPACGRAGVRVEFARLRMAVAGLELPRDESGRWRFAVDVTVWQRPDAERSPGRSPWHRYRRCNGTRQTSTVAGVARGSLPDSAPDSAPGSGPTPDR